MQLGRGTPGPGTMEKILPSFLYPVGLVCSYACFFFSTLMGDRATEPRDHSDLPKVTQQWWQNWG